MGFSLFSRKLPAVKAPVQVGAPIIAGSQLAVDTTMEQILGSADLFNELMIFCESEFSDENPKFLMAVKHYRALAQRQPFNIPIKAMQKGAWIPPEHRGSNSTIGSYLYDTYIGVGAPSQVNIPASTLRPLEAMARTPGRPFVPGNFAMAFNDIVALVNKDSKNRMIAKNVKTPA